MMDENTYKLPVGLCKQALLKFDSALNDLHEIAEDSDIDQEDRALVNTLAEVTGNIMASITNMVMKEISEEDFIAENIDMDALDPYPDNDVDIYNVPETE